MFRLESVFKRIEPGASDLHAQLVEAAAPVREALKLTPGARMAYEAGEIDVPARPGGHVERVEGHVTVSAATGYPALGRCRGCPGLR